MRGGRGWGSRRERRCGRRWGRRCGRRWVRDRRCDRSRDRKGVFWWGRK